MTTYDLDKVLRYGQKIGADVAIIQNGKLRNYYKKGDKASKHCVYTSQITKTAGRYAGKARMSFL